MNRVQPVLRMRVQPTEGTSPDPLVGRAHVENPPQIRLGEPEYVVAVFNELAEPLFGVAERSFDQLAPSDLDLAPCSRPREKGRPLGLRLESARQVAREAVVGVRRCGYQARWEARSRRTTVGRVTGIDGADLRQPIGGGVSVSRAGQLRLLPPGRTPDVRSYWAPHPPPQSVE